MADPTLSTGREHPSFSFPVMRQYTGKVQYRIDGMSAIDIPDVGRTLRGEVKELKPKLAARLVAGGDHAHVRADTEIGQPEEFRVTKKAPVPAPPVAPSTPVDAPADEQ